MNSVKFKQIKFFALMLSSLLVNIILQCENLLMRVDSFSWKPSMFKHGGFSRKGVHSHKQIFTLKNDVYKQRTQHQGKKLNLLKFYRIHWSHKELFKEKIVLELIGNWTQFSPWARRGGLFEWTNLQKLKCSRGYLGGGCWSFLLLSA